MECRGEILVQFSHFISLGYFCSVALELERLGLRSASSPFDWCISGFEGVLTLIENHFEDYLEIENMSQNANKKEQYRDDKYDIAFFHDFNQYQSLDKQLRTVKEKYQRRIKRFYEQISEPTLFVRYISDIKCNENGRSAELVWIEENYDKILKLLRSFNPQNDILFIANEGNVSDVVEIYFVEKDDKDLVARNPVAKSKELSTYFNQVQYDKREQNISIYTQKQKNTLGKFCKKIRKKIRKYISSEYVHNKQYQ